MKVLLAVLCLVVAVAAEEDEARFLTIDDTGATLAINSTSLIYAAIIGIPLLIVGLVVLPLFGLSIDSLFKKDGGDFADQFAYENQDYAQYSSYAKRTLDTLAPVITAIDQAYKKYK